MFNTELLLNLELFQKFASSFNGVQLLPAAPRKSWVIECDSTLQGGGAYSQVAYYTVNYPTEILDRNMSITQLEALSRVHAPFHTT